MISRILILTITLLLALINTTIASIFLSFYLIFSAFTFFLKTKRVLFIASTGGHLSELLALKNLIKETDYYLITEKTKSNMALKDEYQHVSYLVYGTKDHIYSYPFKLLFNTLKSFILYLYLRPNFIITTGAHTAGPMCVIGKIFNSKVIYIETMANIKTKTITGKLIYYIADLFIVQWESMLKLYPKAIYLGLIY